MLLKKYKILIRNIKEIHKRIDNPKEGCLRCQYFNSAYGCNISSILGKFCRGTQFASRNYSYIPDY